MNSTSFEAFYIEVLAARFLIEAPLYLKSPGDAPREFVAKGFANMLSGFLGGMRPMLRALCVIGFKS